MARNWRRLSNLTLVLALFSGLAVSCQGDDSSSDADPHGSGSTGGDGDASGDGDGDGDAGDGDTSGDGDAGDGDTRGDGDGDAGDGDMSGDGDGDAGDGDGDATGDGDGDGDAGSGGAPMVGDERPDFLSIVPDIFSFGYSYYWDTHTWPPEVAEDGVEWAYMYWYQTIQADETVLPDRLAAAAVTNSIPVITHYQLLDRARNADYAGAEEWDIVIQAVTDPALMLSYYEDIQYLMEESANHPGYVIFQTEPDSTTWLRQYHTGGSHDAKDGHVAVAESGHPDLQDLPDTIAGYVQGIHRLRDLYAPHNVYIGLCIFDNEAGYNPQDSVKFINSLGVKPDVLFTHHIVKFSNRDEGWWDAYSEPDQERFLTWLSTITEATGLRYINWQTTIGPADYGLMPDYPNVERITDLVAAGSIGNLIDIYKLEGPPHSQPWHGFSSSPPMDHPAYNSLDKLEERLLKYFDDPISIPK